MSLKNSELFMLFRKSVNENVFKLAIVEKLHDLPGYHENDVKIKIHFVYLTINKKWLASNRTTKIFMKKNSDWLNRVTTFENNEEPNTSSDSKIGRPAKTINECSEYTRKRKLQNATKDICKSHLSEALCLKYVKDKDKARSDITKAVALASPDRLQRIKVSIPTPPNALPTKYSIEEALALFMDLGLSKEKYSILRSSLKNHNVNILPGYKKVTSAKKEAVPSNIKVTEVSVEVKLQDLMDHTAKRLIQSLPEEEAVLLPDRLTLINKWGCDGSSGQSAYKQTISTNDATITDANMFMASVVPLRLRSEISEHWKNPRPSSVHFCRPIFFQYAKESSEIIKSTVNDIKKQISELKPSVIQMKNGKTVLIDYEFFLTMIDGKVLNVITDTSSTLKCAICKKSQKDFQNLDDSSDEQNYEYGISPLHARIRCMEFILKLAYIISREGECFDKNATPKEKISARKKIIQNEFLKNLGLKVDYPKQGYGNTNDGNMSRAFFANDEVTSQITGVDNNIIKRLGVILNVINCREMVNGPKFDDYASKTAQLLSQMYPEKKLTPTVHKILAHGRHLIEYQCLPIGELSEEAQECKNKDYKKFRYTNTCKISRIRQNEDLFNMLVASSDPLISSLRHVRSRKDLEEHNYSSDMLSLLDIAPNVNEYFKEN